jgi:hypothetical protein
MRPADYTTRVVNALGIRWDPAHCEVMLTQDGPTVIEVGARLAGAAFPRYAHAARDMSPVLVTTDARFRCLCSGTVLSSRSRPDALCGSADFTDQRCLL